MGCNHRKRHLLVSGTFPRHDKSIVLSDTMDVHVCGSCGAIRIDGRNEYCYRQGPWSQSNITDTVRISKLIRAEQEES